MPKKPLSRTCTVDLAFVYVPRTACESVLAGPNRALPVELRICGKAAVDRHNQSEVSILPPWHHFHGVNNAQF